MNELPLLTLLIALPLLGALVLALARGIPPAAARVLGIVFSLSTLVLGLLALNQFEAAGNYEFVETHVWIAPLAVHYRLGLDGLSLLVVLLTGLIAPLSLLASAHEPRLEPAQVRAFSAWFLVLQASALGVFLALDFVLWFLFWEVSVVPVYFLVKFWGGPDRSRAALQFVLYTLAGGAALLLGFAILYQATDSFDLRALPALVAQGTATGKLGFTAALVAFVGVLLGVAVKAPLFPFHGWQAPLYAEAPPSVAMFLTAIVSKLGVYAFLRLLWPIFPETLRHHATLLTWLALGGIVLGAFSALAQRDLKRMLAYSSLNHVSYCLLALFAVAGAAPANGGTAASAAALTGALLQIFNHGLSAAALFFFVGHLERSAGGRRGIDDFGGARTVAPVLAGLSGIALFSSLGLPGLNGFVGEFLIFRGVFSHAPWAAAIATIGLLVTAIFLLNFVQRVFCGPRAGACADGGFRDLGAREVALVAPLIAFMVLLGFAPQLLTGWLNPLVMRWLQGGAP